MKIISGGQTGVDRAGLDAARKLGLPHGGWCPRGRRAEDGTIPSRYQLDETASADYTVRTERNVLDSDATLILCRDAPSGGTLLTISLAERHGKPILVVDPDDIAGADRIADWLREHDFPVLNVAGPRESQSPGIAAAAERTLCDAFRGLDLPPEDSDPVGLTQ
ncbi:MAG: putative molybdenum carrier protein [Thermoguttaceae bacterium]|jgi:hypothetical protein|nr:putative molybdenum carrier protein [Thermoguttaceae bacterium]